LDVDRIQNRDRPVYRHELNRHDEVTQMKPNYAPVQPLPRCAFVVAALAATLACGAFIDGLAHDYSAEALQAAAMQRTTVAAEAR
jgi:hypothetical protein